MIPTVHNPVSPMDDQVDILEKRLFARAQCPAHFGLCPSGKLCCPLGGRCCTRGMMSSNACHDSCLVSDAYIFRWLLRIW